jgi:hypothetical protein
MNSTTPKTSGLAIASLVLSCLSVILGPFGCIPGIICGHLGRKQCRSDSNITGEGLALSGLIIGYIFLGITIISLILLVALIGSAAPSSSEFFYELR